MLILRQCCATIDYASRRHITLIGFDAIAAMMPIITYRASFTMPATYVRLARLSAPARRAMPYAYYYCRCAISLLR